MATGTRNDPLRGYNFRIELDNTAVASFREASGLTLNTDPVDYREGMDAWLSVRKLPGLRKYSNITLKRGFTNNSPDLWLWYLNILNGVDDRRKGCIVLQDEQHNDKLRWEFQNGWICKWEGATMNATSNDVAIESIEIVHERLEFSVMS
jgi:phage tail-like protein